VSTAVHQVQARKLRVNFHFQELRSISLLALILWCIGLATDVEDRFPQFHIRLNYSALPKIHLKTLLNGLYFDSGISEADFRLQFALPELISSR